MYALSTQLKNIPIISLQSSHKIAETLLPIILPEKLEIIAFYCAGKEWNRGQEAVLLIQDIRQISKSSLVIDSIEDIANPSEIVRLAKLQENPFALMGVRVYNESGQKLGRVEEYTVNLETFQIQKLYLKQSPLKSLLLDNLVIDRAQILEVTQKQITVYDATITKPLLSSHPAPPQTP